MSSTRTLSAAERLDWLRLFRSENVGPITFARLIDRFGSAHAALAALPELAKRGGGKRRIAVCPKAEAERELEALEKIGGRLVARVEADYPPLLAHVEDAPPVLSVLGHPHLLRKRAVSVVGARNASANGVRFAKRLGADLGAAGLLVVSGMARGIDAAAHAGALATGTVAVLAGGVDHVYPRENQDLYERLLAQGTVVSEVALGIEPQTRHFPRRNRLISGMTRGVVVVEAGARSGSLITARMALEQGREVFAVPGSPMDPRSEGCNQLIRDGATLARSADDVIKELSDLLRQPIAEPPRSTFRPGPREAPAEESLAAARAEIGGLLGVSPLPVDELLRQCQFSPAVVSTVLLELELAGRLERHPGNQVSLLGEP